MNSFFKSNHNPVFFIAEIGGNHEGDFAYAEHLTDLAIKSGADAIKFQLYTGDTLVSSVESPERNAHFKRFELSRDQYLVLAKKCADAGRMFMASVWDSEMLDWINPYIPIHKIGSGDLTCYPIIRHLVATGKPIILSTGLSSIEEVAATVKYIGGLDYSYISDRKLALLQCTSAYPTPDEDANLNVIPTLRDAFGLTVGYSDHTLGAVAIEAAVAIGAEIIEKHFTDTREGKVFRDHKVSLTCDEILELMPKLSRISVMKGSAEKRLTSSEREAGHQLSFRRSIYARRNIAEGEILTEDNITVLRPAHGMSAVMFEEVLGSRVNRALKKHEALREYDLIQGDQ